MYCIQLLLSDAHHEFLVEEDRERDSSMSVVIRELIDAAIQTSRQGPVEKDPLWEMVGMSQGTDTGPPGAPLPSVLRS